jgi:hypothetical protein
MKLNREGRPYRKRRKKEKEREKEKGSDGVKEEAKERKMKRPKGSTVCMSRRKRGGGSCYKPGIQLS